MLLCLIKRISIKVTTRKLKYDFKKSITSVIVLLTLSSGIAYFSGILAKDIVLLYKDGTKKITTSDYTLRILSVNDKNERKEITKEEAIKMQEPYASDDDVIYSITFDGMKFDISENQYNDLCTYDGEISIVYYNKPHAIASITHN